LSSDVTAARTITGLIRRLAGREVSAREAMEECLDRIEEVDGRVRAFLSYDREDALGQADAADRAMAEGDTHEQRPLLGVPVAMKDLIAVRGQPLGCASRILDGFVSPFDATVVKRLKAAGAVVFGRLNMDEFAMGSSTENSAYQATTNPWDPSRIPGGSSGGSAASVVAGEAFGALGSDTGGSIRQPAAFCGCVGLKPTYGRVSRYGLVAFASSLDQIGPLARDTTDAALLLQAIAGWDELDSTSVREAVPEYTEGIERGVKGLRLGVPRDYMVGGLDSEVRSLTEAAIEKLAQLGAEIEEISLPHTDYAVSAYYIIATAEASSNLARFDGVRYGRREEGADPIQMYCRTRGRGFGAEVKRRILLGTYVLSSGYYDAYYLKAQRVRTLIRRDFLDAFERVDAIIGPTTPMPAFRLGEKMADPLQMYLTDIFTVPCNLAGICGMSVPCGFTRAPKLPVGLQLLGKPFGEAQLLRVARAYEQATEWHCAMPGG
jgi:aspartyl-tRNA(Asn)/glutamyl-tRNA(Gln) amidotransferase subunit A